MPTSPSRSARRYLTPAVAGAILASALSMATMPSTAHADPVTGGSTIAPSNDPELRDVRIQRRLLEARAALTQARDARDLLWDRLSKLRRQADRAATRAASLGREMDDRPVGGVLDAIAGLVTGDESPADRAVAAVDDEQHLLVLVGIAGDGVEAADRRLVEATRELDRARAAAAKLQHRTAAQLAARTAAAIAGFGPSYAVTDPAQDRLNRRALTQWQHYLVDLGNAGIVPPKAKLLEDPELLPTPLEPARDARGRAVPGVAEVETEAGARLLVLPRETVSAVSEAFGTVGRPQDPSEASAIGCGGLVARAWSGSVPADAVEQWQALRAVQPKQVQVGDVVFLSGAADEPDRAGIALGNELVITTSPQTGVAAVQETAQTQVLGARRASVAQRAKPADSAAVSCVVPEAPIAPGATGTGWTWPLDHASYVLSAAFGSAGSLWSSGVHTGQDFAAPVGTAVHAARDGVVSLEHPAWAGNLVRIDHGGGVETVYAHLSDVFVTSGERVEAGKLIGTVGSEGNSTGPHLHLEVQVDGRSVDPMPILEGDQATPGVEPEVNNG